MNYITMKALSRKLGGRARSTIYRDVAAGRLPQPTKIGGKLYWSERDIDKAMAELKTA